MKNQIASTISPWTRFTETFEQYTPSTEKQTLAKNKMLGVLRLIREKWLPLQKPLLVMLHSKPGRWKSHLMRSLMNELWTLGIDYDYHSNPWVMFGPNMTQKDVCFIDDLYAWEQSINNLSSFDFNRLSSVLFEVYNNNKILILSSNFSLSEIVKFIERFDTIGRITSRIKEFIGYCPDLELDGVDYREVNSALGSPFGEYL